MKPYNLAPFKKNISGIPGCTIYLDDIIITGSTNEEHLKNVKIVFETLLFHGLRCGKEKCHFAKDRIEYLGYIIDSKGINLILKG